jgi:hypothetical protein
MFRGLWIRVKGTELNSEGLGFIGFGLCDSSILVQGSGFRVPGARFRIQDFG